MKAEMISNEIKANNEIDIARRAYTDKENLIYSSFASVFYSYFDASKKVDAKAFKNAISMISNELERLGRIENSVRQICNATDDEKTEDVLSHFLFASLY